MDAQSEKTKKALNQRLDECKQEHMTEIHALREKNDTITTELKQKVIQMWQESEHRFTEIADKHKREMDRQKES